MRSGSRTRPPTVHADDPIPELTETTDFRLLTKAGTSFGVLGQEETCNGDPARRLGNDYLVSQVAEGNIEQMREAGVKRLVSICPHCVRTIGEDWKEYGADFAIDGLGDALARE